MSNYVTNHAEITRRGGFVLSNSGFFIVACTHCGHQYLYDEEVLQLYPDPNDPSVHHLDTEDEISGCVGCSSEPWDWVPLDPSSDAVLAGPWAWTR